MTRIVLVCFILATCTVLANGARPHVEPLVPKPDETIKSSTPPSNSDGDCDTSGMLNCIAFMSDGITSTAPADGSCCSGFKEVVETGPDCLCEFYEDVAQMGIHLNMTKAMTLPSACGMKSAPSIANCDIPLPPGIAAFLPPAESPKFEGRPPKISPKINMVPAPSVVTAPAPAPAPTPSSGACSISATLALTALTMLGAVSLM